MIIKTIAETAWHHGGDYKFMESLIDEIIENSEADFIKLHITLDFDEYMLPDHAAYDELKKKALKKEQWSLLIEKIQQSDKSLMLLFNDSKAVEFGMKFNPSLIEIHSVCLNDIHLLKSAKILNKAHTPIVLGVGGSTLYEIENAISYLDSDNIVLMHGFQNYPTKYEDVNFNRIRKIMNLYPNLIHGYADHTAWDESNNNLITIMGASLGMKYIEKHVTTTPGKERIDWQAAISIKQFNSLVNSLEILDKCNGDGLLRLNEGERKYSIFGPNKKAAFLKNNLEKGEILQNDVVFFKRTEQISNISQIEVWELFGKMAKANLLKGEIITKDKFE